MQIVIVGGGTVGYELAGQLQRAGHNIALVEPSAERCAEISEKLDVQVVRGTGSSPHTLETAGIREAQMVLAVTSVDEVNILVCGLARQYGVDTRIARIRSAEYMGASSHVSLEDLGVTRFIDPEQIMMRVIEHIAKIPDVVEVFNYHDGDILIVRHIMKEGMPLLDKNLIEIQKLAGEDQFLAVAIKRNDKAWIPAGEDVLLDGDDVTTVFPQSSLPKYLELLDLNDRVPKKAVVGGNGRTAIQLCHSLEAWVDSVTLVDRDGEHAQFAAERLNRTEVILGDPTDRDILREVNVSGSDLFVGAGRETTENVMSALLAKSEGANSAIAVSYEPQSNRLFREIGVDYVLSPRRAMAQEIMDIIHRGRLSVELQLRDMDLESLEIRAGKNSKITKNPLQKVWQPFKRQAIVGAVTHEGKFRIPKGDTIISPGDEVIVVTKAKAVHKIKSLFKGR